MDTLIRAIQRKPTHAETSAGGRRRWRVLGVFGWFNRHDGTMRFTLGLAGIGLVLLLWQIGADTGHLNRIILSSPKDVAKTAASEFPNGPIWGQIGYSFEELWLGLGLAIGVGVVLGLIAGTSRIVNMLLDPWITILYSTPLIALAPVIILFLGIGLWSKVIVVFLIALFPILINTISGAQNAAHQLINVSHAFGAGWLRRVTSVILPGSVPSILTGIRLSGTHAMTGVIIAELISSDRGIGYTIGFASANLQSGVVMFSLVLVGLWGVVFAEVMRQVERYFDRWRA
jgi:ABC-type nitrate/sulfonate/bicarbonate transport system permease component